MCQLTPRTLLAAPRHRRHIAAEICLLFLIIPLFFLPQLDHTPDIPFCGRLTHSFFYLSLSFTNKKKTKTKNNTDHRLNTTIPCVTNKIPPKIKNQKKVWMCGGTLEIAPCSRVGHVFRKSTPYSFPGGTSQIVNKNNARLAEVWLDGWSEFYYNINPGSKSSFLYFAASPFYSTFPVFFLVFC